MPSGRRKRLDPPYKWTVGLPTSLVERVKKHLPKDPLDPTKVAFGEMGTLTQKLLKEWVVQKEREARGLSEEEYIAEELERLADNNEEE